LLLSRLAWHTRQRPQMQIRIPEPVPPAKEPLSGSLALWLFGSHPLNFIFHKLKMTSYDEITSRYKSSPLTFYDIE
jgi:hypothetical protein